MGKKRNRNNGQQRRSIGWPTTRASSRSTPRSMCRACGSRTASAPSWRATSTCPRATTERSVIRLWPSAGPSAPSRSRPRGSTRRSWPRAASWPWPSTPPSRARAAARHAAWPRQTSIRKTSARLWITSPACATWTGRASPSWASAAGAAWPSPRPPSTRASRQRSSAQCTTWAASLPMAISTPKTQTGATRS